MKCNEIRELLSPYIDEALDESEMREVEAHLSACGDCRNEYNEIKEMVDLLGQAPMVPVPDEFRFRLRKGLNEEKQAMIKDGIIEKRSIRSRWRIITSVAAVFAVGVISFGLYHDIIGVLPDQLNDKAQSGEVRGESAAPRTADTELYSQDAGVNYDMLTGGNMAPGRVSEAQVEDRQEEAERMEDAARVMLGAPDGELKMAAPPNQFPNSGAEGEEASVQAVEGGVPDQTAEGVSRQDDANTDDEASFRKEASRSTSSGVEREMTSEEYYTSLLEEKLKDFDYQILSKEYTQDGEWRFQVFIFYGKDGYTYNEGITIIGKGGKLEAIHSGKVMGL